MIAATVTPRFILFTHSYTNPYQVVFRAQTDPIRSLVIHTKIPEFEGRLCLDDFLDWLRKVFRNKLDENGIVSRNKARLVAQGYNQQEGIDYDETYALIARLESVRILLAYAYALDYKLFQMDVKRAFLNGFINEEVYMAQPLGFVDFEKLDHVYKLKKALYGLKQAPKAWPDIMFSVCLCDRFQEAPKTSHLEAVKHIFRYIKGTMHLGLWYPKRTDKKIVVYADSDHAGDYVDQKSTSGICTFVGYCLTSWFSKKQTALAISTTEAEY
nr:retrovirus-related Pol polyprotein from transposon TNT 1-94 [Tanacetum cinerariifolium]